VLEGNSGLQAGLGIIFFALRTWPAAKFFDKENGTYIFKQSRDGSQRKDRLRKLVPAFFITRDLRKRVSEIILIEDEWAENDWVAGLEKAH